ncbi:MAG TPA: DUF499 domain-containing protein [Terriglobales bacterium]|jgi:hypothetical protein|nr:DUF499 domain-containing protein [Terriglobales bacterium]
MDAWYKVATPRAEVREGRSFNPDEFAIALEQLAADKGPDDYRKPDQFFARTCFTRALREHMGMVLRRLAGRTDNSAPVMTLVTQFGGGKTHTLAALLHLARHGSRLKEQHEISQLIAQAGLSDVPTAKVAVFVGNAFDPSEGRETPWIDIARQLAGADGVQALGPSARDIPPGTTSIAKLIEVAGGSVLILCDEVLNYINRYRGSEADKFHAFIQNLTVALTGTLRSAAVISLPRSQVEMSDYDLQWQEKINKVVRRVAKDLIANDEAEISEVVRKRLFEDIGPEKTRKSIAKGYADWCFERRNQLPPEWTAVDSATTDSKAREFLRTRFELCYPFHPAALSVFHRKWQGLRQFQQTRGALAMFAQWISYAYLESHRKARQELLITLGSAPLESSGFRAAVLGQLGESRLQAAIDADIAGLHSHAQALDADTKGILQDIHRRVATAILFESSGAQADKSAHLPELRFALGEPGIETTSIDNAASQMEARGFFIRKKGSDGYQFGYKPTLKKVVNDRRASLDDDEVGVEMRRLVQREFERGKNQLPLIAFPEDGTAVSDVTRLSLVVLDPESEWTENGNGALRRTLVDWTRNRGNSARLYPGALIWCVRRQGRELRNKVEVVLAWRKVQKDYLDGTLAGEFDRGDRDEISVKLHDAEEAAKDEVWAAYRYIVLSDSKAETGLRVIDLGAGHAGSGETLASIIIGTLKRLALLNDSPGAGYLERKWPEPFRKSGAWPVSALRQAFLNGTLERVLDPDVYLRARLPEFVMRGDFGFASGQKSEGGYSRIWFGELMPAEEIVFDSDVYLVLPKKAEEYKASKPLLLTLEPQAETATAGGEPTLIEDSANPPQHQLDDMEQGRAQKNRTLRIHGEIPTEVWQRLGRTLIPKLKGVADLRVGLDVSLSLDRDSANGLQHEIHQILQDLKLEEKVKVEWK